ncbi:S-layer homology domain-containing protein [Paenibacillus sp. FSL R7-0337]|uniref:S-layer homology domain-containing protein n=3 Tax=Paenibacillus sp. FSL R7-0337 TaxID=1926588 RepID=UPI0030D6ECA9
MKRPLLWKKSSIFMLIFILIFPNMSIAGAQASADTLTVASAVADNLDTNLNSVIYENGTYTAVGEGGRIVQSADGMSWSKISTPSSNAKISWRSIAFTSSTYVAVGVDYSNSTAKAKVIVSTDGGGTWSDKSSSVNADILQKVRYINGIFYAVGGRWAAANRAQDLGVIYSSADGQNWSQWSTVPALWPNGSTTSTTFYITDIINFNGKYVITGNIFASYAHSGDGSSWTPAFLGGTFGLDALAVYNGKLYVSKNWENGYVSSNGMTFAADSSYDYMLGVVQAGSLLYRYGREGKMYTSANSGGAWTAAEPVTNHTIISAASNGTGMVLITKSSHSLVVTSDQTRWARFGGNLQGSSYNGNKWEVVGNVLSNAGSELQDSIFLSSSSGWDQLSVSNRLLPKLGFAEIAYGNNVFVAAGKKLGVSGDGENWTVTDLPAGATGLVQGLAYGTNGFVAVAGDNVLQSADGVSWTVVTTLNGASFNHVKAVNGGYVAFGTGGIWASTNGTSWSSLDSLKDYEPSSYITFYDITYANGKYAVIATNGNDGTPQLLETSGVLSDTSVWTKHEIDAGAAWTELRSIDYGNGYYVAAGVVYNDQESHVVYSSKDLVTWTQYDEQALGVSGKGLNQVRFQNDKFYIVGNDNTRIVLDSGVGGTPETTPGAVIDYTAEQLTGLTPGAAYTVNGQPVTVDVNGKLAIDSGWLGTSLSIVKKGDGSATTDSVAQTLNVPSRPAAPAGVASTDETAIDAKDGTLINVNTGMEYKRGTAGAWSNVAGTSVTTLEPDTYYVRTKATAAAFVSEAQPVTVNAYVPTAETTPGAVIDYTAEQLTGLTPGAAYTVNGQPVTVDVNGKLAIDSGWLGTSLSIVKKGDGSATTDSVAQTLNVPSRPAAPAGMASTDETAIDAKDGTLINVNTGMEYKRGTAGAWSNVAGTSVTTLEPDTYYVRTKATAAAFVSEAQPVTVNAYVPTAETTPGAVIDYTAEQLTGLTPGAAYTVNGQPVTADVNGKLAIASSWLGASLSIVKKGDGSATTDSVAQTLNVPSRPAAPAGVTATDETAINAKDGTLTNVTAAMEYKRGTAGAWSNVAGTSVTTLEPDTYYVRTKATAAAFVSEAQPVTVNAYVPTAESTPAAVIDYAAEQLTSLTAGAAYTVNGQPVTADVNGKLAIASSWLGASLSIVKKGDGSATTDSVAQTLNVPSRPAAPAGVTATDETAINAQDGALVNVDSTMEYKKSAAGAWGVVTGTAVTGLAPDTYYVRVKATATDFASEEQSVAVELYVAAQEITPAAEINYEAEQLTGLVPGGKYVINGTLAATADVTGRLALDSSWLGITLSVVKQGNATTTVDSAAQTLIIPSRPAAPASVASMDETGIDAKDGTLINVNTGMEYKRGTAGSWTAVTGTTVTGLAPDMYFVRTKATATAFTSAEAELTITSFAATAEVMPNAIIDYAAELLTGLIPEGVYTVNGTAVIATTDGTLPIDSSWLGSVLNIVKTGNGVTTTDSDAQMLSVPARQAAPVGVSVTDVTYNGANDGTLQNLTVQMEYQMGNTGAWTEVTAITVTGLIPGTYYVRVKATSTDFASVIAQVTVHDSDAVIPSAPEVVADDLNNTIMGLNTTMEFSVDEGPFVRYDGTNLPDLSGEHTVKVRVAASGSVPAGPATTLTFTTNVLIPAGDLAVSASDPSGAESNGYTQIKVTPAPAEGHKLLYKNFGAGSIIVPNVGDLLTGYTLVGIEGLVPAADGDTLGIAEVDAEGRVVKYGSVMAVVAVTTPVTPTPEPVSPGSGGNPSTGSNTNSGTPSGNPASTVTNVIVLVNGKEENAGTATTTTSGNTKTTIITVDPLKLQAKLDAEGIGAVVTIPVMLDSNIFVGELNGQMIKNMENVAATLVLQTGKASYTLPASEINIGALARQFGTSVKLEDIKLKITIGESSAAMNQVIAVAASKGGFDLVAPSLDFTVTGTYGNSTVEINRFDAYVKRTVEIPGAIDPNRITTGIVVEPDGTVRHVPTQIIRENNKYYAEINSLTNSSYSVVWHPLTFADVEKHWAKAAVNDMGSRLVINGVNETTFNPNADITRAEFAAIIVRGLGLRLGEGATSFADVPVSAWYAGAVQAASEYGLINGFEDGNFRPDAKLTREQAMTIIAKAMKLTGLADRTGTVDTAGVFAAFTDAGLAGSWAKDSLALAAKAGLISGRSGNKLEAKANVTRAEVAVLMQRLLQKSDLID